MQYKDIAEILKKQRDFFNSNRTKEIPYRLEMLKRLKTALKNYEDRIAKALFSDLGKSHFEAYATEIGHVLEEIGMQIRHLKSWARPRKVHTPVVLFPGKSFIYPEPYGLVLIISPWNYPLILTLSPLISALSAGNCAVIKPSRYSPAVSQVMETMIGEYFGTEYISVFQGGSEINQILFREKFDFIVFTGSPEVGKIVMEAASKNLTPVILELGGKSPAVVDREADIELAAKRIVWGKFLNAGQTCVAPDYVLADKEIKTVLIEKMKKYLTLFFGADPEQSTDFSRIISDKHMERLTGLLKKGTLVTGGKTDAAQRYIAPVILDDITPDDPVMQEEIFGPILPIIAYNGLDEAIRFINHRPKPLALYFFSGSRRKQQQVIKETTAGGCAINDTVMHLANPYLPFGGIGNSGMGAYHGDTGFNSLSHFKSIYRNSTLIDLPVRYPPSKGKLPLIKFFLK